MTTETTVAAGRDLDALVAEKVMGLVRCQGPHHSVLGNWPNTYCFARTDSPAHGAEAREYSTDIADAWLVIEKLREDGWCIDIRIDEEPWCAPQVDSSDSGTGSYDVSLLGCNRGRVDARSIRAYGETMSLAICLAALKAVEEK